MGCPEVLSSVAGINHAPWGTVGRYGPDSKVPFSCWAYGEGLLCIACLEKMKVMTSRRDWICLHFPAAAGRLAVRPIGYFLERQWGGSQWAPMSPNLSSCFQYSWLKALFFSMKQMFQTFLQYMPKKWGKIQV